MPVGSTEWLDKVASCSVTDKRDLTKHLLSAQAPEKFTNTSKFPDNLPLPPLTLKIHDTNYILLILSNYDKS